MEGKIHSIQSFGTLDGPGLRFVIFFQGCNLRCGCCHNPDTWNIDEGIMATSQELINKVIRYKEYFNNKGGITISGGEPLLQPLFAYEIFKLAHDNNINTCLDTSGSILNDNVKKLLTKTDRVLLDIKYLNSNLYTKYVGCKLDEVLKFLDYLQLNNIKTTLRQVIIPTLNDNNEDIIKLNELANKYSCVDKVELLPFKKMCISKYENLNIDFRFKDYDEPSSITMTNLNKLIDKK